MRRGVVAIAVTLASLAGCNALLAIDDVASGGGVPDGGGVLDASEPLDASPDASDASTTGDALGFDVAALDVSAFDAPLLGDVVRAGSCELNDPGSCGGATRGCIYSYVDGGVACMTVGGSTTTCPDGDPECAAGFACLGGTTAGTGTCERWCRFGVPSDCDGGTSCTATNPTPVIDGTSYGLCL